MILGKKVFYINKILEPVCSICTAFQRVLGLLISHSGMGLAVLLIFINNKNDICSNRCCESLVGTKKNKSSRRHRRAEEGMNEGTMAH